MTEARRPDELLIDELTDQLDRTRRLLAGSPAAAAERAMARAGGEDAEAEARLAAALAAPPLADVEHFETAHQLVLRALEILERDGHRHARAQGFGPLSALARPTIEFVAAYVVRSHVHGVVQRLLTLYAQREAQCAPDDAARHPLRRARVDVGRIAPAFRGGGVGAPVLLGVGAAIPALASLAQQVGAISLSGRVLLPAAVLPLLLFLGLSWALLRGAGLARRRSQGLLATPLTALWETIGEAGDVPEDGSVAIATVALVLTALVWFALPALIALGFVLL